VNFFKFETDSPSKFVENYRSDLCNAPPPRGRAYLHQIAYLGHRLPSQINISLFCTLYPHSCATSRSVIHPQIVPGQACLTLEFFTDQLPEKKLQLVRMSILLILLSLGLGCHNVLVYFIWHILLIVEKYMSSLF